MPAVAHHTRIHPVLVRVAVESFPPVAAAWESDPIPESMKPSQVDDHHHIMSLAFHPPVEGEDPVVIVHMHHAKPLSTEDRRISTAGE
jgi:hypothetical protein